MTEKSRKSAKKPAAKKRQRQAAVKHRDAKVETAAQPAGSKKPADDTSSSGNKASASGNKSSASGNKASAGGNKVSASGNKASASGDKSSASGDKASASGKKPVDAIPPDDKAKPAVAPAPGRLRAWLTESNVTRFISALALIVASASLAYVITVERNAGLLANSARAVIAKAGIGTTPVAPDKATMLSSIQYLSSAARGSEPFSTELAVTYKMVGDHPEIGKVLDEILPGAETGIPSVEDITTSYADIISEIYGYGPGQLLGQAASSITSIVGIKTSAQQRQATIEQVTVLVAAGKLEEALQALSKLDGQSRLPFAAWQIKAQRRVALDAAVSEIKRIAFLSILDGAS